jgi:hypothetical protein
MCVREKEREDVKEEREVRRERDKNKISNEKMTHRRRRG